MLSKRIAVALAGFFCLLAASPPARAVLPPVTIPASVAPVLKVDGTGLCIAQAMSSDVIADFDNLNAGNYNGNLNSFMEMHKADRFTSVLGTLFDLSNNNNSGLLLSYGDFTNVMLPQCKIGGCDFHWNDTTTPFAARVRGFFNVTPDLVKQKVHFGFYADDAVSLTFYGKSGAIYPVVVRPPQLGLPTYRLTNTVTFQDAGLYPLEVLYVEIAEHAALEMSYFVGDYTDFERPANAVPVTRLSMEGFSLFTPKSFSQTLSGEPSFPDATLCQQCDRQFVNLPGNNGCKLGYYCNDAALCAPCDSAALCGDSCAPCGDTTPYCLNVNGKLSCGACRDDADCGDPTCKCDPTAHTCSCHQCEKDSDCARGDACVNFACTPCDTADKCAGASCNCCPPGNNAKAAQCRPLVKGGKPTCTECYTTADCAAGVCDVLSGLCVDKLAAHESADACGDDAVKCPVDAPFCLPGHVGTVCATCRDDFDCKDGEFCRSGLCDACTVDRRCGTRCETCSGDKPYCLGEKAADAMCVRCTKDDECVGGKCDTTTHDCAPTCTGACTGSQPHCDGKECVGCYADTQCPCGGTCDFSTHTCSTSCKNNGDCADAAHCRWNDDGTKKECTPGPMMDDSTCGSTLADVACTKSSIGSKGDDPLPIGGVIGLSLLALLRRRRSSRRGAHGGRS